MTVPKKTMELQQVENVIQKRFTGEIEEQAAVEAMEKAKPTFKS